jgi:8-oxo-dGTP pyrophosphatase MutT (NUDIX family)
VNGKSLSEPIRDVGARCLECGYNLTGTSSGRCPECGWEVDADLMLLASERSHPATKFLLSILCLLVGCVGLFPVVALFGVWNMQWFAVFPQSIAVVALLGSTSIAGVLLIVLFAMSLMRKDWPIDSPRFRRSCWIVGGGQVVTVGVLVAAAFAKGDRARGVVEYAIYFGLGSGVGWVLLIAASVGLTSRRDWVQTLESLRRRRAVTKTIGAPFLVEASGRFSQKCVLVSPSDVARSTTAEIEADIERTWSEKVDDAKLRGANLYNGELGRLVGAATDGERLLVVVGRTTYREFVGTNLYHAELGEEHDLTHLANPLGTSAIVITRDGFVVMGRRNDRVGYHAGYLHTFGGTLEASDARGDGGYDVFGAVRREIREELGVEDDEIADVVCTGLVRDRLMHQPELVFDARLTITRSELMGRFDGEKDEEHTRLESCGDHPEAIVPFLESSEPVAPVAMGAMMLHGLGQWGGDWYEGNSYLLFGDVAERREARPEPI